VGGTAALSYILNCFRSFISVLFDNPVSSHLEKIRMCRKFFSYEYGEINAEDYLEILKSYSEETKRETLLTFYNNKNVLTVTRATPW